VWVELVPSGVEWLDAGIGGFPATGVVAALGSSGAGKTSLALGFAVKALTRGRTCFLTSESADAVLETSRTQLEHDLRPHIAEGRLTVLSFAPFFTNKVRSLNSVDAPFAELKEFFTERQIQHVVFDTVDPLLTWIDAASATAVVRGIMGQMMSWKVSVLCTMSGNAPAIAEFARTSSGSLELSEGKLTVHQAAWCNVYGIEAPVQFVQGRGFVVRGPTGRSVGPVGAQPGNPMDRPPPAVMHLPNASPVPVPGMPGNPAEVDPTWQSLIGNEHSLQMHEQSLIMNAPPVQQIQQILGPQPHVWQSLLGDSKKIMEQAQAQAQQGMMQRPPEVQNQPYVDLPQRQHQRSQPPPQMQPPPQVQPQQQQKQQQAPQTQQPHRQPMQQPQQQHQQQRPPHVQIPTQNPPRVQVPVPSQQAEQHDPHWDQVTPQYQRPNQQPPQSQNQWASMEAPPSSDEPRTLVATPEMRRKLDEAPPPSSRTAIMETPPKMPPKRR
jgi:KaiC/GvpD/RAD55 family RecA-like ATPase